MENNNLANAQSSQAAADVSVVYPNGEEATASENALLDAYLDIGSSADVLSAPQASTQVDDQIDEASSEESDDGNENQALESADEDNVEIDEEEVSPPTSEVSLIDTEDFTENDLFPYKNSSGVVEEISWPEIHNRLRRAESASSKSREANALIEDNKTINDELQAERDYFSNRRKSEALHPEVQQASIAEQHAFEVYEQARQEGSLDFALHKDNYERARGYKMHLEAQVQQHQKQQDLQEAKKSQAFLRQKGLGYLFEDDVKKTEFLKFIDKYPKEVQQIIRTRPDITMLAVDALNLDKATNGKKKSVTKTNTRRSPKKGVKRTQKSSNHETPTYAGVPTRDNYATQSEHQILDQYLGSSR